MTNREILMAYREAVLDMQELQLALNRTGSNGRPKGLQALQLGALPGTNDPAAAALQAAEGIEAMLARKREELTTLGNLVAALMSRIGSPRTYMVIQGYYLRAETDANIAAELCMSRVRVNQIRNQYLAQVG